MADPTPYTVDYSFAGFQANSPTTPLPGAALDNELAGVAVAVAELITALEDVRRSDGALQNGIVTFDSLELGLQLTFDPTNGSLVAAAVAGAQASAVAAAASNVSAAAHDTSSGVSAAAAAASAATVNLSLYLAKANNLAGLGSNDTALNNIGAAKVDGSTLTGRLAPLSAFAVIDWNAVTTSGFQGSSPGAANTPDSTTYWLVQTIAGDTNYAVQFAYPVVLGVTSAASVLPMRRSSYFNGVAKAWWPWESMSPVAVGSTIWVNGTAAPVGYLKENGALISRVTYPALYTYAAASGNIVSEASWSGGNFGAFSTGDLATTFRIPDTRGQFVRAFDDGRGIDTGRVIGTPQADDNKAHTHAVTGGTLGATSTSTAVSATGVQLLTGSTAIAISSQGSESRPKNNAKLACIKY